MAELGIAINPHVRVDELTALAERAEARGLDLVVVPGAEAPATDPWTAAAWIAGLTTRIQIAVSPAPRTDGGSVETPSDAMVEKAVSSLRLLAGPRLLTDEQAWTVLSPGSSAAAVLEAAADGAAVAVSVSSPQEVDQVAAVRGSLPSTGPARPAAVRALRAAGIDYDDVPPSLRARAVEPGDADHAAVSSTYLRGGSPGLVLRPRSVDEVREAIGFARRHPSIPLGIRSAGHGISGRSTNRGGLVIDVGALNAVEVIDVASRRVRIGPGATWKQVAAVLHEHGWAIGSGDYGGVGVGGLATAGGIGYLSRRFGLTIDHLRAVELVLADGTAVRASDEEHPDLFWAMRGAGANFGVATSFELVADELAEVGFARLTLMTSDLSRSLTRFGELASGAPRDTTAFLVTGRPHTGQWSMTLYAVVADPSPEVIVDRLSPFLELGVLARQDVVAVPYRDVMALAEDVGPGGQQGFGEPSSRSGFLPTLDAAAARRITAMLETEKVFFFELRTMGGAIADVPPDRTAFAHRTPQFQVTAMGGSARSLDEAWEEVSPLTRGLYLSFETRRSAAQVEQAFPPRTLERLRALKRRLDPDNLFRDNFNVLTGQTGTDREKTA
jgi:hypothetical protein